MNKWIISPLLFALTFTSSFAGNWAGEWQDDDRIQAIRNGSEQVLDVKIDVYNMAETAEGREACGEDQCYRLDIFINDKQIATWATSPGYRRNFVTKGRTRGTYTPHFSGQRILWAFGRDYESWKYKFKMKYAMYIEDADEPGEITNFALHGGYEVTGRQESRGCLRMRDDEAALLNSWITQALNNDGEARIWARGTRVQYREDSLPPR